MRANRERFPHPNPKIRQQKKLLPDLLAYIQEEVTVPWHRYCIKNLADLTIEFARNELISIILPSAVEASNGIVSNDEQGGKKESKHNEEAKNEDEIDKNKKNNRLQRKKADCLLSVYLESPISLSTTLRWLRRLGFPYGARKITFFVDGHERPNVVFHSNYFCENNYLSKLETQCHPWVQKKTAENCKREKTHEEFIENAEGYHHLSNDNIQMVEFHVDNHIFLHSVAKEMRYGLMGGNMGVRKPELPSKPPMILGQMRVFSISFYSATDNGLDLKEACASAKDRWFDFDVISNSIARNGVWAKPE